MKAQPLKGSTEADLAVVPSIQENIKGSQAPLRVLNLRGGVNKTDVYYTGGDVVLNWQYFTLSNKRSGAGMFFSDKAWAQSPFEGLFSIIFRTDADVQVARIDGIAETTYTLTNDKLLEYYDFEEPSTLKVAVILTDSGLESEEVERTITLIS